jgi:lysophospholipase L1-like esterase
MHGHPARSWRCGRPLVALVLAGAVVTGCGSDGGPARVRESVNGVFVGRDGGRRIVIAGDSITDLSRPAIVAALAHRYEVRVDGFTGRTIGGVLPALAAQVATHPDVAVVNLGTNDMVYEHRAWRPDLERMLRLVAEVPCVEVFTIYDGAHEPPGANIGTSINARLAATAAAGSVHLVDWNAAVRVHPGLVVADRIHPSLPGQRWIARSIRDAIASDC